MNRINWWFWIPFILGAALRAAWVWSQPLWYDENFTLAVIRLPLPRMMEALAGDVHPPLFYLLIRPLALLDIQPWMIRLPSVLMGIASLPLAWVVFGRLASVKAQRAAFALFALFASANIFYSQEARMYALLTLLLLAAVWAMLARRWVLLGILAAALLYTQNYALLYLPALWLAGMVADRSTWKRLTLALALAGISFIPWVPTLLQQQSNLAGGYWIPPLTPGVALIDLIHALVQKGTFRFDLFSSVILIGWGMYALAWYLRNWKRPALVIALIGYGPWLLAILGSIILGTSIMHYRSLVPLAPYLFLWLAIPLVEEPMPAIVKTEKQKQAEARIIRLAGARDHLTVVKVLECGEVQSILTQAIQFLEAAITRIRLDGQHE